MHHPTETSTTNQFLQDTRRTGPETGRSAFRIRWNTGLLIFSLISLALLLHSLASGGPLPVDKACFGFLDGIRTGWLTSFFVVVTFCGTGSFLIPMYIILSGYYYYRKQASRAQLVVGIALSSVVLGWLLKPLFHRTRPLTPLVTGAGGTSFPSGHALGGFTFSLLCLYLIWQSNISFAAKSCLSMLTILFCVLVALSRVYLHVHFATDVLGSLLIAVAWTSCGLILFLRRDRRRINKSNFAAA